jgi:hypothetical protein
VVPGAASIAGQRRLGADLFLFKFGPTLEVPLNHTFTAGLSGGFALAYVQSDFSFGETVSISGLAASQSHAGAGSHCDWLPGGYVAATLTAALNEHWAVSAGAQFQSVGHYTHSQSSKQAVLDLSQSIFVTLGLSYSF